MTQTEPLEPSPPPFNRDFCELLEYHLGKTFANSERMEYRRLWCDGVSHLPGTDGQLERKWVNDKRRITTKAWIGENGQGEYEMTIHFGKYALRRYAKGRSLEDCLPDADSMDWIELDMENRRVDVYLR